MKEGLESVNEWSWIGETLSQAQMWLWVELLSGYWHSLVPIYLLQIQMSADCYMMVLPIHQSDGCSSENSISVISLTSGHDSSQKKISIRGWQQDIWKPRYSIDQPFFFLRQKWGILSLLTNSLAAEVLWSTRLKVPISRVFTQQLWLTTPPKQKLRTKV
jgi:hypothetical protein